MSDGEPDTPYPATEDHRDKTIAAIREGLADADTGRVKPAREALDALAKQYGIPVVHG